LADPRVRVQLCGRVCVEIGGERRESLLPGPQGRRLFAYLTLHRLSALSRRDLVNAIWGEDPPTAPEAALGALLSRLRRALAPIPVGAARLSLPDDAWVDLEAAREAAHRAESAMVRGDPGRAWGAAQITLFTARRGFLSGESLTPCTCARWRRTRARGSWWHGRLSARAGTGS
jgi:SARP family transcriptional regulator, regulator of embCAB operon